MLDDQQIVSISRPPAVLDELYPIVSRHIRIAIGESSMIDSRRYLLIINMWNSDRYTKSQIHWTTRCSMIGLSSQRLMNSTQLSNCNVLMEESWTSERLRISRMPNSSKYVCSGGFWIK